jgi:hypothetical protein
MNNSLIPVFNVPKSKIDIYPDGKTVVISRIDSNLYPVKKIRKVFIVE